MAKGIITSREQRAQFDQAVKDVIKQRKTANAIQMAAREHKQLSKNGGPSNAQQAAQLQQNREKLRELIRTPEFAMLNNNSGSERKQSSSSSNNRRQSTHLSSSIISTQSTCVNQEGLQKLREQHPRRSSSSLRKSGSSRRLTVSGPAPSSLVKSLPNELEAARRSSDPIGGDNPRARRRFSLDKSNSFNVFHQSSSSGMGKKGGMPRVGSEGYALDKMGDGQSLTLNSMGGGQGGGGLSKTMHPRNYTSGMSSSSNSGGMGHRSSSSGGMKNGQNDGRLVPTYRPLSKTKGGKVPVAAAATSSTGATKENATWGFPSRRSTTQTAMATESPHKVKTLNGSPGGEGCETYLSTSTNSRKSPPENLNNEGLEEDDRKLSSEGRRGEFAKTISSSSRSGSGRISLSSRSGGIGAVGALDLENIKEGGDGSIISDSSSPLGALSNGLGGIKLEELVPTRRKTRDISDGERPSKEKIDQWRDEDLILEPGGDFKMAKKGDEETTFHDAIDRQQEDESPSSFHTANTSSAGNQDVNHNVCPREMLKLQAKSQSGGTGPTTGTSASSLMSSEGSFRKITPDQGRGNAGTPDFEAIKEEGKDAGGGDIGNTERSELASGDSVEHIAGFSTYKNRRSSRMKKIRKSIKKTLMGTNGTSSTSSPRGEASSQGGTTISEEQQKRLSQHFQRKSSARSLMSANTSFSAVTTGSNATNSSQSTRRWPSFRRKSVSMSNVMNAAVARGSSSSSKNILVNQSSRSNVSFLSEDDSGSKGSHLDFYDNSDHVRAVRTSIITARSHSGRSIVSQLETVDEPSQGEQKHDEDFLQRGKSAYHMYMENSSHCSDDTAPSFYRHPSHEQLLVHMRPNQLFPDSPGWQCDKCGEETFDLNVWAYISTEENYCLCESCFIVNGFVVDETP